MLCSLSRVVFFHHVPMQYMKKSSLSFTDLSIYLSSIHHLPGSLAEAVSGFLVGSVGLSSTPIAESANPTHEAIIRLLKRTAAGIHRKIFFMSLI